MGVGVGEGVGVGVAVGAGVGVGAGVNVGVGVAVGTGGRLLSREDILHDIKTVNKMAAIVLIINFNGISLP